MTGNVILPPIDAHPEDIAQSLFPIRQASESALNETRKRRNVGWETNPLIPAWVDPEKVDLDRFFTRPDVAKDCYASLLDAMANDHADANRYKFVEPSAGEGAFFDLLPAGRRIGIEIVPGRADFECCDFLDWKPTANGHRYAVIGNPPFGYRAWLALVFMNHAASFADYMGMILPMGFQSNGKGSPKFRVEGAELMHSEYLPSDSFVLQSGQPAKVNALWQIWKRGINNRQPIASCDEWIDLFTVDCRKERQCGHERISEADWFLQRTFFGNPPRLVRSFDEVRYGCGYGIVIRKQKTDITEALNNADWRKHSNLAAHNCRHISMEHIRAVLVESGFHDDR